MEIVAFTPQDQAATASFMRTIYEEMGWKEFPEDGLDNLKQFFHLPDDGFLLLVKDKNKIIGTGGAVKLSENDILLKRFYIDQKNRGSGIGKELLDEIVQKSKPFHCSRMVLDVSKNNLRAIRFYEKNGFKQYHQAPIEGWPESSQDWYYYYYLNI